MIEQCNVSLSEPSPSQLSASVPDLEKIGVEASSLLLSLLLLHCWDLYSYFLIFIIFVFYAVFVNINSKYMLQSLGHRWVLFGMAGPSTLEKGLKKVLQHSRSRFQRPPACLRWIVRVHRQVYCPN